MKFFLLLTFLTLQLYAELKAIPGNYDDVTNFEITLDGSESTEAETYSWEVDENTMPEGATYEWTGADTATPTLKVTKKGDYTIKLTVEDGAWPLPDDDDDDVLIKFIGEYYENSYVCDLFYKPLTSYTKITSKDSNAKVVGTASLSTPEIDGDIICEVDGEQTSCVKTAAPLNEYSPTLLSSSKLGTSETQNSGILEDVEYGDFKNMEISLTLHPQTTYGNNTNLNFMLLGDMELKGSNNSLTLASGDYYFKSLTLKQTDQRILLEEGAQVRIFIEDNLEVSQKDTIINDRDSSQLFIYVGGDTTVSQDSTINAFVYTAGKTYLKEPANINGGLTSVDEIIISKASTITATSLPETLGYGNCPICYLEDSDGDDTIITPYKNIGDTLSTLTITENPNITSSWTQNKNNTDDLKILDRDTENEVPGLEAKEEGAIYIYDFGSDYPNSISTGVYYRTSRNTEDDETILTRNGTWSLNEKNYNNLNLGICRASSGANGENDGTIYHVGDFDAWDYPGDDTIPAEGERYIQTKIFGNSISLQVASLNGDSYEGKTNSDSDADTGITYAAIYENSNLVNPISQVEEFKIIDPEISGDKGDDHKKLEFTPTKASKSAGLYIKMCATYESSEEAAQEAYDEAYKEEYESNPMPGLRVIAAKQAGNEAYDEAIKIKYYEIYPYNNSDCVSEEDIENPHTCDYETDGTPVYRMCSASDPFSIRPKEFVISSPTTKTKSGEYLSLEISAKDVNDEDTPNYNINSSIDELEVSSPLKKYLPNGDEDSSLHGDASINEFSFSDGVSSNTQITFDDVGVVGVEIIDTKWTQIDREKEDGTSDDCDGLQICSKEEIKAEFIPHHFTLKNIKLHNHNDGDYTYFSNDIDISLMSAHLAVDIEAQNANNEVTQNFDKESWEHPIAASIEVTAENPKTDSKPEREIEFKPNDFTEQKVGFVAGKYTIAWDETDKTKALMFNYEREINGAMNPFEVKGSEVTLNVKSTYDDIEITGNASAPEADKAKFFYVRTSTPRALFKLNNENSYIVPIFYEVYCSDDDKKSLLPDGDTSTYNDDPRWFVNTQHDASVDGVVNTFDNSAISLKSLASDKKSATLKLNAPNDLNYPYKTTMQVTPSSWLIYNKYDEDAETNEFEVEFNKDSSSTSWAGKAETTNSTSSRATSITNRRSMW